MPRSALQLVAPHRVAKLVVGQAERGGGGALVPAAALQRRGVESRLLVFPDENHWVLKPENSVLWHRTVFDWLARHLKK